MKKIFPILFIAGIILVISTQINRTSKIDLGEYTWEVSTSNSWTEIDDNELRKHKKNGQKYIEKAQVETVESDEAFELVLQIKNGTANTIIATKEFDRIPDENFWSEYVVSRINETNKVYKTLSSDVIDNGITIIYIDDMKFAHSKVTVKFPQTDKKAYFNTYMTKLDNGFLSVITTAMSSENEQEIDSIVRDSKFILKQ